MIRYFQMKLTLAN